jgi:protein SCO1/2
MDGKIVKLKAALLALGALMFMFGIPSWVAPQGAAGAAQAQAEDELRFSCPMHPEVKSKNAGLCPKCNMTLKLKPRGDASGAGLSSGALYGANYFPNVQLTTQDGKVVRFYDDLLKDKVVAIALIYTRCLDNCPLETARMAQVQRLLGDRVGKDIYFYSISIDPKHDTPEALKAYAKKFKVGPGWTFLTGKEADIELISKKLGLYSVPDPSDRDGHMPSLLIGNVATGQWRKNSALDNPSFLVWKMEELMDGYNRKVDVAKKSYADAPRLNFTNGEYLFSTRCAACHTVGKGDAIGPDLLGVVGARDRAWLRRIIAVPDKLLAENDPLATALFKKYKEVQMPNLRLGEADVESIIGYMEALSAERLKAKAAESSK